MLDINQTSLHNTSTEDLFAMFYFIIAIALLDKLFFLTLFGVKDLTTRWFMIHICGNAMIVYFAYGDVIRTLTDSSHAFGSVYDLKPSYFAILIHLYHLLFFTNLSRDDLFHHGVFVTGLGFVCLMFYWGTIMNMVVFFICGLPGCIGYSLLVGVKFRIIDRMTEKYLSVWLNLLMRSPGLLFCLFVYIINIEKVHLHPLVCVFTGFLMIFNAQYYVYSVIASYVRHQSRRVLKDSE